MGQTVLLERLDLEVEAFLLFRAELDNFDDTPRSNAKLTDMVALMGKPDLLDRLFRTGDANLSAELASFILGLDFDASERARIDGLADKSNSGTLTPDERAEYEWYVLLGDLLSLLQIKARASLKKHQPAA